MAKQNTRPRAAAPAREPNGPGANPGAIHGASPSVNPAATSAPSSVAQDRSYGDPSSRAPAMWAAESVSMASEPSEADIRMRAYQRYLDRGGNHGADLDDWLAAEHDLKRNG